MSLATIDIDHLTATPVDDIIDVRAPSEFAEDHIPNAISLPVLSDAERAQVGSIYVQDSPFKARKIGAALVAQNAARHLQGALADRPGNWQPVVYCWRGGQRSGSFASILDQIGWRVAVIRGGYQSYRRQVAAALHDGTLGHSIRLLDGNTGTAKTEILNLLAEIGVQTLDLEGLARHRGSVFGYVEDRQPAQKMFESRLWAALKSFSPDRPVVVEAESAKIGDLYIPPALWRAMRSAPRISISAPLQERAKYLTQTYADITQDTARLEEKIKLLTSMQGHERVAHWCAMAQSGALVDLAQDLMAHHYDPRYLKSRSHGEPETTELVLDNLSRDSLHRAAERIKAALGAEISA